MACFEDTACYNFIFCKKNEPEVKVSDPRKLEITVIQSTLEEVKKTMSDSESDSGVGSVRTNDQSSENDSANENQQKKTVTLITPKLGPKPAKSSKPVKRSESVMSRFSFFFPAETEKLADMLVEEFKKNDQSNGLAMERMFRNQTKQSDKPEATKKIKKKKSFKQLIMGTKQTNNATATQQLPVVTEKVEEATSDDVKDIEQLEMCDCQSSSPDVNAQNRKKRMKKRRQARKNFDEDSSSLSSNGQEKQQQQQQQQQVIKQETTVTTAVESEAKLDS